MNYPRITLQISSCTSNLNRVEKFLDNLKNIWDIQEEIYFNILTAVTEAVTNAIIHGNKNDVHKLVSIAVYHDSNICMFTIEDEGRGFDYKKIPNPTLAENILKLGGRGIYIMKKLTRFLRFAKKGSCVKMFFYTKEI